MPPASVDQYVGPSNSNYMTALTSLQSSLDQASKMPPEQMQQAADQTTAAASSALLTTRQTALTLGLDPDAHIEATIQQLMEDPITYIDAVKPNGASPAPLNGAGADFCSKYRPLMSKYPFDANSKTPATLDEVNAVFKPQQGTLWQFYDQKLNKLLAKQGNVYAAIPGAKPALTNHFVAFFNNSARFSNALFANGTAQDPKINFAIQPAFSDLQTVALTVNGQTANFAPNSQPQKFVWPGNAGGVRLVAKSGGSEFNYPNYDGLWGLFEFFSDADRPLPSPEWMLKSGRSDKPVTSPTTNQPIVVHFNVDMLGAPPVFQKGYFRELACVAEVAH
jgi:type VI secretion system protein ImpL